MPVQKRTACTVSIRDAPERGVRYAAIGTTYGRIEIPYWLPPA